MASAGSGEAHHSATCSTHTAHQHRSRVRQRRNAAFLCDPASRQDVIRILPVAVEEVVPDIPHDALVPVLQGAFACSLACPSVVGLEGTGPRVALRDIVAVIGPDWLSSACSQIWLGQLERNKEDETDRS